MKKPARTEVRRGLIWGERRPESERDVVLETAVIGHGRGRLCRARLAAALASGLWGIENRVTLPEPVRGNAYDQTFPEALQFPRTLYCAAQRLKASETAREWFGDAFVDHYAASREWEEREFRKHITDWELERYFEII